MQAALDSAARQHGNLEGEFDFGAWLQSALRRSWLVGRGQAHLDLAESRAGHHCRGGGVLDPSLAACRMELIRTGQVAPLLMLPIPAAKAQGRPAMSKRASRPRPTQATSSSAAAEVEMSPASICPAAALVSSRPRSLEEVLAALAEALYCEHPYGEGSGDAAGGRPRLWVWLSQGLEPVAARPPIVLRRVDLSDISEAFPVARR
ncbi:MAG: hypothetical protein MZW92_26965 [Comamonadaceae bacterium]|nr:hypothetical protein [Comamonadaceae bacterium]